MIFNNTILQKPSAFIDCDGVLRNSFLQSLHVYKKHYDPTFIVNLEYLTTYSFKGLFFKNNSLKCGDTFISELFGYGDGVCGIHSKEVFEDAPLIETNIKNYLSALKKTHNLFLISAQNEGCELYTVEFLKKNSLEECFSGIYFSFLKEHHTSKNEICQEIGISKESFIVEDSVDNLKQADSIGLRAICFNQPYNKEWDKERIYSFKDLLSSKSK
jgi:hypothetical protein